MIRVTVELLPFGNESKAKLLGVALITNDCTGTKASGNYVTLLSKKGKTISKRLNSNIWKKGTVTGFPRLRNGHWSLLYTALRGIFDPAKDD